MRCSNHSDAGLGPCVHECRRHSWSLVPVVDESALGGLCVHLAIIEILAHFDKLYLDLCSPLKEVKVHHGLSSCWPNGDYSMVSHEHNSLGLISLFLELLCQVLAFIVVVDDAIELAIVDN